MEILRNFAVFEGLDGSGTTTQLNILNEFFHPKAAKLHDFYAAEPENKQYSGFSGQLPPFFGTFEPTDGIIGKIIRSNLRKEVILRPETIALLFAADRNEHIYGPDGVAEHCARGELVVSDRYLVSSLVYQGITCGDELPIELNRRFPGPEMLLFFDIDPETAQKRMEGRNQKEIYEYLDFQMQVRGRYKALLPQIASQGTMVEIIDASPSPEEVAGEVWSAIKKMSIFKG